MLLFAFLTLSLAVLGLTAALWVAVRFFLAREAEWRQREKDFTDRLLRREGVAPLQVQVEQVAKIPDPEAEPPRNPVDEAMYLDDLLEDLQHKHNLGAGMTPQQAMHLFPVEWDVVKREYDAAHKPLRVG